MFHFSLFLNLIIDIWSRSTPQIFCCCYHRQNCKKNFLSSAKYSKPKTYLKATHSMEKIIQPNIGSCKKSDLNITLLPIMYWLPKIHKTLLGVRFIVASYYCSTNPLPDTIFKLIFNTVEIFHKKLSFIQAVRNSVLCKIVFQLSPC